MQHDFFRSDMTLTRGQNCENDEKNDLLRSNYSSFEASQKEKHDDGKINVEYLLSQK